MAKLFIQNLPSKEELKVSINRLQEGVDTDALHANLMFLKIATELENHMDSHLAKYNLSIGRFTILCLLEDNLGGLKPTDLSSQLGVTQATMSGLVSGLEKNGLVQRKQHEMDGRAFLIHITDKGRETLREIFPRWSPSVESFWNNFSSEDKASLNSLLERMMNSMNMLTRA